MLDPGAGDLLTGFGLGLALNRVIRAGWVWPLGAVQGTITLTIPGKLYASPNATLLVAGLLSSDYPYGQILTPSSSPSPVQNFAQNLAPQVPLTTLKEEAIGGLNICTKTQDAPGYPTEVFDCTDPFATACNCPDGNKRDWEFIPLSEVGIGAGSLIGLGEDGDPRFPSAYIVQNGSTCIKKCNKYTGYCYVGPPGCTPTPTAAATASVIKTSFEKTRTAAIIDPGLCDPSIAISGTVSYEGSPLPDVVMNGFTNPTVTGEDGSYIAMECILWSNTVTPFHPVYVFNPPSITYTDITHTYQSQDYNASLAQPTITISGRVTDGGNALGGVVMTGLYGYEGYPVQTDTDGSYSGSFIPAYMDYTRKDGDCLSGTVTPTLAGYAFDPPSRTYECIVTSQTYQNYATRPRMVKKQEKIGNLEVCSEQPDASGCPTQVYSCNDQPRTLWDMVPLSEVSVVPGTLQWIGSDNDPTCPTTYIVTEGSTCVKKCTRSGYCLIGPPGCTP